MQQTQNNDNPSSDSSNADPTNRFSNRVADYIRYRPHYPPSLLELLRSETGFSPSWKVADVGSGTGILTAPLLDAGNEVYAVEPNQAMREGAENLLVGREGFHSIAGTAEATTLEDASVDLVVAAQAFHWFEPVATRREFVRISRSPGWCLLVWNARRSDATPFLRDYEELLLRHGTDYAEINHRGKSDADRGVVENFFAPSSAHRHVIADNFQHFDFDGLKGRLFSSSYIPPENDPRAGAIVRDLHELFDRYQSDGTVRVEYDTQVYIGKLHAD